MSIERQEEGRRTEMRIKGQGEGEIAERRRKGRR